SDKIDKFLEILEVVVVDQDETDVTHNGQLNIDVDSNTVTFDLEKQYDRFEYLIDQTYTMIITSKIKEDVTDSELLDIIDTGIPNQADLIVNDTPTPS